MKKIDKAISNAKSEYLQDAIDSSKLGKGAVVKTEPRFNFRLVLSVALIAAVCVGTWLFVLFGMKPLLSNGGDYTNPAVNNDTTAVGEKNIVYADNGTKLKIYYSRSPEKHFTDLIASADGKTQCVGLTEIPDTEALDEAAFNVLISSYINPDFHEAEQYIFSRDEAYFEGKTLVVLSYILEPYKAIRTINCEFDESTGKRIMHICFEEKSGNNSQQTYALCLLEIDKSVCGDYEGVEVTVKTFTEEETVPENPYPAIVKYCDAYPINADEIVKMSLNPDDVLTGGLPIFRINTSEDLKKFRTTMGDSIALDDGNPSFNSVTADYGDEFFKNNSLVLCWVESESASNDVGLEYYIADLEHFHVQIYERQGGMGICVMSYQFIIIELPDGKLDGCQNFSAYKTLYFNDVTDEYEITNVAEITETESASGLMYIEVNDDNLNPAYMISGIGKCTEDNLIIPETNNGRPVIGIYEKAFYGCTNLVSVEFPPSIREIGGQAFAGCTALETVTFGEGLGWLGDYAFTECYRIKKVMLPNTLYYTGVGVFSLCFGLEEVCFADNSIRQISESTFKSCENLKRVNIPVGVRFVCLGAFASCRSLTEISLPSTVTDIYEYAFDSCPALTSFRFDGTVSEWKGIQKATNWNSFSEIKKVLCSDGEAAN